MNSEEIEGLRPDLLARLAEASEPVERLEAAVNLHTLDIGMLLRLVDQLVTQLNAVTEAAAKAGWLAEDSKVDPLPGGFYL